MFNMSGDTEKIAGKFRAIETTVRMIKERKDSKKYNQLEFSKVINLLSEADGFSKKEIEMIMFANKLSGSAAHGNYSQLMDKIDEHIHKRYFPKAVLSREVVSKTKIDPKATGLEVLEAVANGPLEKASGAADADIYEAFLVAKTGGYVQIG